MLKRFSQCLASFLCLAMLLFALPPVTASAAYYDTFTNAALLGSANGCSITEGFAVGSGNYVYSVKIGGDKQVIYRTQISDGSTTLMTNGDDATTYTTYLGHANDLVLTTINGDDYMFIVTMNAGSMSLVKLKYISTTYYKVGNYTIQNNGADIAMSGVKITGKDANDIHFLFKKGINFYRGTLPLTATSGTISVSESFNINIADALVNGSTIPNITSYVFQGFGYYDDTVYVPMTYGTISIVLVYRNTSIASGTIYADDHLSFRITAQTGFEMESVGIAADGKLWFNINGDGGNPDGVYYFNGYNTIGNTYTDDFSDSQTMENYSVVDMGTIAAPSNWSITGGYLSQTSNIYGPTTQGTHFPYERGTHLVLNKVYNGDWDLSTEVKAEDDDGIGLVFGYQDSENFYRLEWEKQTSKLAFWKSVNQTDTGTVIGVVTGYPYDTDTWYTLKVEKRGTTYKFYVDGVLKMTASDTAFDTGKVGLLSRGSLNLTYDNFSVVNTYTDDFSDSQTMANYNVVDMGTADGPSNWSITGGYLSQTSNIYGPTTQGTHFPYERGTHLVLDNVYNGDWDLSTEVKAEDDDGIGLVFGYQDSENFYRLEWEKQTSKLAFWKSVNQTDTGTVIGVVTGYPYDTDTWYTLKVEKRGTTYKFYVDGVLKMTASDTAFNTGKVGLLSRGSFNLMYDNFSIVAQ